MFTFILSSLKFESSAMVRGPCTLRGMVLRGSPSFLWPCLRRIAAHVLGLIPVHDARTSRHSAAAFDSLQSYDDAREICLKISSLRLPL